MAAAWGLGGRLALGRQGFRGVKRCEHRGLQGLCVLALADRAVRSRRRQAVCRCDSPGAADLDAVCAAAVCDLHCGAGEFGGNRVAVAPHRHQRVGGRDALEGQLRGER